MKMSLANKEWTITAIVWLLIYASDPLYMLYAHMVSNIPYEYEKILRLWSYTTAFLVIFLIHHFLIMPLLVKKKKTLSYIGCVTALIAAFVLFLIWRMPENDSHHRIITPEWYEKKEMGEIKPPMLAPPDLARVVMALMMIIADVGAMAWINEQKLRQQLLQLEKHALDQELVHLRYQINPHFFMNTLNNIHALVDIDQECAKRSIVELSKLMRYSLYEGNESLVPLQREMEFVQLYISLMKLRFGNKLRLNVELPEGSSTEAQIPPLLLATFVENAFKHGISYQKPSYISISLTLEGRDIHFQCENSRHTPTINEESRHGIGLANVRKRLDLQYKDSYKLMINDRDPERFHVELQLPTHQQT